MKDNVYNLGKNYDEGEKRRSALLVFGEKKGQQVSHAANFGVGVRIARGRAILVRWSPCWSLILRVSQSKRAGFGRAAEEQGRTMGKQKMMDEKGR